MVRQAQRAAHGDGDDVGIDDRGQVDVPLPVAGLGDVRLDPVGEHVVEKSSATSKSAVSRRFVAMTDTAPAELLQQDQSGLDLVALMIDGAFRRERAARCRWALTSGATSGRWR